MKKCVMNRRMFQAVSVLCAMLAAKARGQGTQFTQSNPSGNPLVADKQTMMLFEVAVATLVVVFFIVFLFGMNSNKTLARSLANNLTEILSMQFEKIGVDGDKLLLKDGHSYYWFYATGRRYTSGLTVLMDLAKRMDLFSYTSSLLTTPQKDKCIFFLPLTHEFNMEPISLFLVRKKELTRLKDVNEGVSLKEVEALGAHVTEANGLPSDFVVMTEHSDVLQVLLPESIRSVIRENARHIVSVHVTDNGASWEAQSQASKRLVRVEFTLPVKSSQTSSVLEAMSALSLHLVDLAAEARITPTARKKALDLRKKAAQEGEKLVQRKRAEEAANRKQQKKKEEEEAVGKMSREKQIKYEEKKRKKEIAARMKKATRK